MKRVKYPEKAWCPFVDDWLQIGDHVLVTFSQQKDVRTYSEVDSKTLHKLTCNKKYKNSKTMTSDVQVPNHKVHTQTDDYSVKI